MTIQGYKLDLRFYLLLRKGAPQPEAYMHKRFLGRLANVPYSRDQFDNFEKHCTVFHYRADLETKNLLDGEAFIQAFDEEYGHSATTFEQVRLDVHKLAADLVKTACCYLDKKDCVGSFAKARSLLGLDIMLEQQQHDDNNEKEGGVRLVPRLLEVTYQPDLRRVLRNHPSFINEVFKTLVLDEPPIEEVVKII